MSEVLCCLFTHMHKLAITAVKHPCRKAQANDIGILQTRQMMFRLVTVNVENLPVSVTVSLLREIHLQPVNGTLDWKRL